jgi:DoxX-like family
VGGTLGWVDETGEARAGGGGVRATSVLGAILLTAWLGGAVATNARLENPWFSHTLFPVYFGVLVWGGLFLRDARLRALLPLSE